MSALRLLGILAVAALVSSSVSAQTAADEEATVVIVAARDLAAGEMLKDTDLVEARIPARFATKSVVPAEGRAHLVSQRVLVPMLKGDWLTWASVESALDPERIAERCGRAVRLPASARDQVARSRQNVLASPR